MNDAKHTKGPWKASYPDSEGYSHINSETWGKLASVPVTLKAEEPKPLSQYVKSPEGEANARLIAAAPRMYDRIVQLADSGDVEANSILEQINGTHGKS